MTRRRPLFRLFAAACATMLLAAASGTPNAPNPRNGALPVEGGKAGAPRPNFILILVDDMDSLLGSLDVMPVTRTQLARRGATFSNAYVPISLCCPSRASILTGLYPHNHGIYTNDPPDGGFLRFRDLGNEGATLPVLLRNAGYRTALYGKYMNGYPEVGEETYIPPGWNEWISPAGDDAYSGFWYTLNDNGRLVTSAGQPADYLTDVLGKKADSFVRRNADRPYFLYLSIYSPHRPANAAPRHQALYADAKAPRTPSFDEADVSDKPAHIQFLPRLTAEDQALFDQLQGRRLRSLRAVDELVGKLVKTLRATGQLDRTYLVFASDNGWHMGQHRLPAGKYTPYEEDIRVPFLVRGPGIPAGKTFTQPVLSLDLAPTFAELAKVTVPAARFDGRSLVPLLTGRPGAAATWRQLVLVEQRPFEGLETFQFHTEEGKIRWGHDGVLEPVYKDEAVYVPLAYAALRTPDAKYVEYHTGEREYYDLRRDPHELENRARDLPAAKVAQLSAALKRLKECGGATCREADRTVIAPAF